MVNNTFFSTKSTIKFVTLLLYIFVIFAIFPISSAIFFAYFIYPVVKFCNEKLKIPYFISILFVSSLFFSVLVLFLFIIIQSLLHNFTVHSNKYYVVPFHLHHTPNVPTFLRKIIRYFKQYSRFYRFVH